MKIILRMFCFLSVPFLLASAFGQSMPGADLIVLNAKVWTSDKNHPTAQAVAVLGDLPPHARDHDAGRPKKPIFHPVAAPGLTDHDPLRNVAGRFMRDGFVQVWIKFLAGSADRLQPVVSQEIH